MWMTLDEAIDHALDVAEDNLYKARAYDKSYNNGKITLHEAKARIDECIKCSQEHQQLAGWLMEVKRCRM